MFRCGSTSPRKRMKLPVAVLLGCAACLAQSPSPAPAAAVTSRNDSRNDELVKGVDNLTWRLALGEVADVDNITYTSLPPRYNPNPTAQCTGNPLIIHALTFIPKNLDRTKKHPLILLAHGGVHRNFGTMYIHIVRNSWGKGTASSPPAIAVAPGYSRDFYDEIDYGGREIDDVFEGRKWMLSNYSFLDPARVGIMGWSHGGLITLMNIFQHPDVFAVAYAGSAGERSGGAHGLQADGLSGDLLGEESHREDGGGRREGVSTAVAAVSRQEAGHAAADPHQHKR